MNSDAHGAERSRGRLPGWCLLLIPPLFWAGNFVVGRAARADVPPMLLAFARHLVALVVLLPFGWATMRRDLARYWACRWQILRTSLAGMVVFNLLVYSGLHATTASNAQLLNSTIPVLIVLLGAVLHAQRLGATQIIGLVLSCAGVLTIVLHGDWARLLALQFSHGDVMVFAAMMSFALFSVWLRDIPADIDRLGLLGAQLAVAVVLLFPLVVWEHVEGERASWDAAAVGAMLYVGIAASLLANLLYMTGIARVGPARAGMFIHLVPLYGAGLSIALLGEHLQIYHAIGMAAIMTGLACANMATATASAASHAETISATSPRCPSSP